jgi:hypothetical protein
VKTINFYFTDLQMADIKQEEEEYLINLDFLRRHPTLEVVKCTQCKKSAIGR